MLTISIKVQILRFLIAQNLILNKELSVSVWIKMESQDNNDYIISLDRWIGYKLNLQSEDKLYYTIRKQTDPDTWEFVV